MSGGIVFIQLAGNILINFVYGGRLTNSSVVVSAMGIGFAYLGTLLSLAAGWNIGYQVLIARCYSLKLYDKAQE